MMKRFLILLVLSLCSSLAGAFAQTSLEEDFRLVGAPETSVSERDAAIDRLKALPFEKVALPLAQAMDRMASPGDDEGVRIGIWNASSPEAWRDPNCPPRVRPSYALHYIWDHFETVSGVQAQDHESYLGILTRILGDKSLGRSRGLALGVLKRSLESGRDDGELLAKIDAVARGGDAPLEVRRQAIETLFEFSPTPQEYLMLSMILSKAKAKSPLEEAENFRFSGAIYAFGKFDAKCRRQVLNQGFELLEKIQDGKGSGYFLATVLGDHAVSVVETGNAGREYFKPDQNAPEYQGPNGLNEAFFQEPVNRALAWWAKHKGEYR